MRNGRYCLPVKAEYRSSFHGMLHDQSATGATLFIEPNSVVKLNNEIRELERLEQDEIDKVLADLSNQTAEQSFLVEQDHRCLLYTSFPISDHLIDTIIIFRQLSITRRKTHLFDLSHFYSDRTAFFTLFVLIFDRDQPIR